MNKFKCPDGETIDCQECLTKCRLGQRCMAKPVLKFSSNTRNYKNRRSWSTTELLAPTCQMFLKAKYGEVIDPFSIVPSALGTAMHAILEGNLPNNFAGEFRLEKDGVTGQMDCVDLQNKVLYDYKVVGTYKALRMLGYETTWAERTITRGKRKGETTLEQVWRYTGNADFGEYHYQQNLYRLLLKDIGIDIQKMYLQVFIKEPAGVMAQYKIMDSYGQIPKGKLTKASFLVEIPMVDDDELWTMIQSKREDLSKAIESDIVPEMCSETWNGKRCQIYCSVNDVCPYYKPKRKGK